MERLRHLLPELTSLRQAVTAVSVGDAAISARIRADRKAFGQIWCPHTAVAAEAWANLPAEVRRDRSWCLVATASPAKFPEIVEALIGESVPVPPALADLLGRPTRVESLEPTLEALRAALV
jgi:threonine synthase